MIPGNARPHRSGLWLFFAITFGWSWGLLGIVFVSGADLSLPILVGVMAGPGLAAFTCAFVYDHHRFFAALGLSSNPFNIWLLVAFTAPLIIIAISHIATQYLGGREILPLEGAFTAAISDAGVDVQTLPLPVKQLAWLQVISAPLAGATINTLAMMLTEEVGWRGWLWDRWSHMPFWQHALLTGFIWGLWHAPVIALGYNYPELPLWGPVIFIAMVMLMTPIIALVRERGGSMAHAAMFHGVFNAVAPITVLVLADQSMPWRGAVGLGGFGALALGCIWVMVYRMKRPTAV